MNSPNARLSRGELLTALSNVQRRKLLDSLIADSPPNDGGNAGITVEDDVAMYHSHLPKLADCRLVDWDKETNRVTKGPNFEAAVVILEALANDEERLPPVEAEA